MSKKFLPLITTNVSFVNVSNVSWVLNDQELSLISYIDIGSSLLSVIGAASIIVSVIARKKVCKPDVIPIFHLSLADLLASLSLFIDCILFQFSLKPGVWQICNIVSAFTMACYVITFSLTLTYAIEVYLRMHTRTRGYRYRPSKCLPVFRYLLYILSWFIPIALSVMMSVLFYLETKKEEQEPRMRRIIPPGHDCSSCLPVFHYNEDICLHSWGELPTLHVVAKYLFLIPLILIMVTNAVLYLCTYKKHAQLQDSRGVLGYTHSIEGERLRNKAIQFQVVFFVCWFPSLLLGFFSLSKSFNMRYYYPLFIIQALTAPLQGFVNCIIYGWYRQSFTNALRADDANERTHLMNGSQSGTFGL
ncbi:transmembrane protein 116-like isoform X2 [Tubulanus polymorphus]|uniref:transmembrane protein 116-like isoform X2 n=1 Tax=Tubulanus polymorphus TaxID=672921 RepID=UPI003DA3A644